MKTYQTTCHTQITRILAGSNAYLVTSGKINLLVDTGKTSSGNLLLKRLDALLPLGTGLDFLVLTHTHFDHCQNVSLLQKHYGEGSRNGNGFRIIIHDREKDFAMKGFTPLPEGTNWLTKGIVKIGNLLNKRHFSYQPFIPDILTSHQTDLADSGCSVRLLETPGHTSGSISVIIDDEIAIVGDALFGIFPYSVFPPFVEDVAEMIKSWQRLLQTGALLFLPGHGREIGRGLLEREVERYKAKNKKSY